MFILECKQCTIPYFATGLLDTGGKFTAGLVVVDSSGKFATSVTDTSGAP